MENKGLISVIIPVYNAEGYLQASIDSVLGQSYGNIELILVDDGSKDRSGEICRHYADTDSRVKVISQENRGVSAARNAALDAAVGEWIIFADADDRYLPGAFEALLKAVTAGNGSDLAVGSSIRLEQGNHYEECGFEDVTADNPLCRLRHYALWGYIFRHDIIRRLGLRFREELKYSEDRVFIFEYAMNSRSISCTSQTVYLYRIHPASACQSADTIRMTRLQFQAVSHIRAMAESADAPGHRDRLARECDLIVRFSVEKAFASHISPSRLSSIWALMQEHGISYFSSRPGYYRFCIISRIKGLKRKLLGRKQKRIKIKADSING